MTTQTITLPGGLQLVLPAAGSFGGLPAGIPFIPPAGAAALAAMAAGYSTAAVSMGHLALKRAIRHAEANDLVARNVAALADTPKDFMAAGASVPGG